MKQQLHYHISLARLTLLTTFGGLLFLLIFARTVAAQTQTFNPTYEMSSEGNIQNFTVPTGVTSLTITAKGSVGGGTSGGKGATMKATFAVTPGALLKIVVGAKGHSSTNNANYGGGGGGSFVAVGDINEANLLIAAGGGGGGGLTPGSDASTTAGDGSGGGPGFGTLGGGGGGAGINGNGEDAGLEPCTGGAGCGGIKASAGGSSGNGGAVGGFGGGGGAGFGGGGGGGYTGGKGGNQSLTVNFEGEGGGGGSSYTKSSATAVSASVNNTGVGQVIIEWTAPIPTDRFVTTWVSTTGSFNELRFNALTTDLVSYSYTTNLGKSGSGQFFSAAINNTVFLLLGNTIAANEVVTLVMEPSNLKQVQLGTVGNTPSGTAPFLTGVTQWGSTAWVSMESAFRYCANLNITATDVPNLGSVSSMRSMFDKCSKLNGPANIGSWNTTTVTDMSNMFAEAAIFNQNIGSWNTANVTNMVSMFFSAGAFNQNISGWNTANVTDMSLMFSNAGTFNQPIGAWNTANVTNMRSMFQGATNFNQHIGYDATTGAWNTGNVTDMNSMFFVATAFNQNIGNWNTAKVTNMSSMFRLAAAFNQNIGSWDVSNVTTMNSMFLSATAFNQNIGSWNTAKVTDMGGMFESATAFNQNIGAWNTAAVTSMGSMFRSATVFNQDISYNATTGAWNTGKVTNMSNMFNGATAFNQPIGTWNTGAVTNMSNMFQSATAFNQPIGTWNTGAVTNMSNMFNGATTFNQAVGTWNVSKVTNMRSIFSGASAFNQNIGTWTLAPTADIRNLLDNCGMNCQNYSATLVGWANNPATPNGRTIGASGRQYGTDAVAARTLLDIDKTWNFSGDASSGMACLPTPTLSSIANQATCDGQTISNIAITLGVDLEAVLSASDDNTNLNPTYTFGGTGANRTLTIATVAGQVGATTVTVTAMGSFGTSTTRTFLLEVGNKTLSYTAGTETSVISQENGISGLAIANDGKIYVGLANTINKIRQYDATGGLVNADYISLNNPRVLYFGADGKLYVMSNSKDIRKYNGQSLEQSIDFVSVSSTDLVTNAAGDVFYVNTQSKPNGGVSKLPANFTQSSTPQNIINNLASPFSLALSPDGSTLYVPITSENRVIKINADGSNASDFILTTSPTNVAFDKSGQLWLGHNGKLSWVGPNGELNTVINSGLSLNSLEFDADGNIYGLRGSGSSQGVYKYTITKTAIYETCNAKPVFNPTTLANRTLCVSPTQVSLPNISITVTDPDGNIAGTVVTSSNPSLIVATNGGTASAVQLSLTQQANQSGTATITIESTDDLGGKSTLSFSITVNPTPNATATPSTQTICSAGAITPIVLTSNLTGTTYTWSRDNTGTVTGMANSGSGDISGTLSNPTNAPVTVTFTIVPTGSAGNCPGTPITASVTVNPVSAGGSIGGAAAVCTGTNSTVLTLSNQVGSIQKWQSSLTSNFANPTDIPNTATVLTASNLTQATYYRAVVQSGVCAPVFSASATITVDPVNVGGSAAGSATVCSGTNSTALTLSNQVGSIQKWQSSLTSNFANPTDIANTATGLTASNLTQTTYYRAVVQSGVCAAAFSSTATVTVNPLPTAGISGTTAVCQNASSPSITFTGGNGTAPYTFTYTLNGETKTITAVSGNSVSISQTTAVANTFTYTLVSVKDASSTQCSQSQGGTAIVTVNVPPVVSTPQTELCTGQTLTLSPTSGGIWVSSNPTVASVTNAGLVTGLSAGAVNFTYTPTTTGCSVTTNNLLIKQTPSSALTASKYDVCPNTTITLDAHCSIPTATVNWNPGAPTVTPNAATLPYLYKARCVADGCTGNESSVEVRTHRILVDMKDLDVGVLPLPIARAVKDNLAPTNLIEAPTFPRRWTFMANGCDASESAVFILSGPVNFSAIDNTDIYALFSNEGTNFYSLDHPNYGNGGSFPNGTYTLTIDLRSRDGAGGPFPKNRIATGSLLASRTLQFTVKSPASIAGSRQGSMSSDLVTAEGVGFAEIAPNPVSHLMRLKVAEAKGQSVKVSLMDAVGRTMLQRSFVPETNQHQEEFEVSHLTHGMYFLRVNAGDKQTTLKVVKVE